MAEHIQRVREFSDAAVIVNPDNQVLSEACYTEDKGVKFHASVNAIANACTDLEGCTLYVRKYPCNDQCAKLIIQSGIKKVVHIENEIDDGTNCTVLYSTVLLNDDRLEIDVEQWHD